MGIHVSKKVGIKDIAAKAGISIGTVDRVLHDRGDVNEETKRKVLEIVEELGYKPNILANDVMQLSPEKNVLLFILDTFQSDVFAEIITENFQHSLYPLR